MSGRMRTGRRHHPLVNRAVLALLRSPLHRIISGRICELSYEAPSDGRSVRLPVAYAHHRDQFVVLVADAGGKRWWRAFNRPHALAVQCGREGRAGVGLVIHPDHPSTAAARAAYERRHSVHIGHDDRLLLIDLKSSAPMGSGQRSEPASPSRA